MKSGLIHFCRSGLPILISFFVTLAVLNRGPLALINPLGARWALLILISLAASFVWVVLHEVTDWIIDKILAPLVARSLQ